MDDPCSAVAAQVLPTLLARSYADLLAHLVGPPPDRAAPVRERLVACSRLEAALLARKSAPGRPVLVQ